MNHGSPFELPTKKKIHPNSQTRPSPKRKRRKKVHESKEKSGYKNLDDVLESAVNRGAQRLNVLPEIDGGQSTLGDTRGGELELLVYLLVGTGRTEAVESEGPELNR